MWLRCLSLFLLVTMATSLGAGILGLYEWRLPIVISGWAAMGTWLFVWRRRTVGELMAGWRWGVALVIVPLVLCAALWPRITGDGLNGDGTEAFELARSLREHPLPRWEIEAPAHEAQFGVSLVVPYITGAALAQIPMTLVGESPIAVRMLMPICLGLLLVLLRGRVAVMDVTAWIYLVLGVAAYVVWSITWVSYDPPFDIAEPAGTNLLTTLLFVLGTLECVRGSVPLGVVLWTCASLTTFGGPVLTLGALVGITWQMPDRARRVWQWTLAVSALVVTAFVVWGSVTGDLHGWIAQIRNEYWRDLIGPERRVPAWPVLLRWGLLLGLLPLVILRRWTQVSPPERVLAVAAAVYCGVVVAGADKSLHYLMPVPFLVWPAALAASTSTERVGAALVTAAALVASWPATMGPNPVPRMLGADSCIVDLDFERASLASRPVEDALAHPRHPDRLGISRHAWVRHTLEEQRGRCVVGLSPEAPDAATLLVQGRRASVWTRDLDAFVEWRLHRAGWMRAPLFDQWVPVVPSARAADWGDDIDLRDRRHAGLVLVSSERGHRRLLVPAVTTSSWRIELVSLSGDEKVETTVVVQPDSSWGIVPIADGYEPVRLRRILPGG